MVTLTADGMRNHYTAMRICKSFSLAMVFVLLIMRTEMYTKVLQWAALERLSAIEPTAKSCRLERKPVLQSIPLVSSCQSWVFQRIGDVFLSEKSDRDDVVPALRTVRRQDSRVHQDVTLFKTLMRVLS